MQTNEAIRARRSVRKYKAGAAVPPEHVKLMLEAAMMAPSAVNSRPWEFYVVEKRETLDLLMQAHPACKMLETATLAIAVCGRPDLQPGRGFWPQDCGAAVENILLQATDLGYGTCWCGCYPAMKRAEALQKVLDVTSISLAVVAVGKAAESPQARGFYDPSRVKWIP